MSDLSDVPQPNGNTPVRAAICAFLVVCLPDGGSEVVLDINQRFSAERPATPKDVYGALTNAVADWEAMKTAEAVMAYSQQIANQAALQQLAVDPRLRQPGA